MRSMVEGWLAQTCSSYPSTTLRVVPLPTRFRAQGG